MLRCLDISSAKLISPPSWTQTYRKSESMGKPQSDSSSLVGLWPSSRWRSGFHMKLPEHSLYYLYSLSTLWSTRLTPESPLNSAHCILVSRTHISERLLNCIVRFSRSDDPTSWHQLSSQSVSMSWQNTWEYGTREVGFILTYGFGLVTWLHCFSGPCNWWAASTWWSKVFS